MGDLFRKQQAKNFKRGRDRAIREASQPRFFERAEVLKTVFTVQPLKGDEWKLDERLLALMDDANGPVNVVRGYQKIGTIEGDGGELLKAALLKPEGPSVATLRIVSISELSGTAKAEMVSDTGQ